MKIMGTQRSNVLGGGAFGCCLHTLGLYDAAVVMLDDCTVAWCQARLHNGVSVPFAESGWMCLDPGLSVSGIVRWLAVLGGRDLLP
jgi:hypothetical protein